MIMQQLNLSIKNKKDIFSFKERTAVLCVGQIITFVTEYVLYLAVFYIFMLTEKLKAAAHFY